MTSVKRGVSTVLVLLFTAIFIGTISFSNAREAPKNRLDVILVIDETRSMRTNDPDMLCSQAMKQFVDMLSTNGDQVGVVTYSYKVLDKLTPQVITAENNYKQKIKKFANDRILREGVGTDVAVGLLSAKNMLDQAKRSDANPIIILVSDGENDYRGDRNDEVSNRDLKKVLEAGYPVYAIGLLKDGAQSGYLSKISSSTGGQAYFPKTSKELPDILKDIQNNVLGRVAEKKKLEINPEGYTDYPVTVPKNAYEVNIQAQHLQPIEVIVLDSEGKEVAKDDTDRLQFVTEEGYTNIKLMQPLEGEWKLRIKGSIREEIRVDVIFNYEVFTKLTIDKAELGKKEGGVFRAKLVVGGDKSIESSAHEGTSAVLKIYDDARSEQKFDMAWEDGEFVIKTPKFEAGSYVAEAVILKGQTVYPSNRLTFSTEVGDKGGGLIRFLPILVAVLLLAVLAVIGVKVLNKPRLLGNLRVDIVDTTDGFTVTQSNFVNLAGYGTKADLQTLLVNSFGKNVAAKYSATSHITLVREKNGSLVLTSDNPNIVIGGGSQRTLGNREETSVEEKTDGGKITTILGLTYHYR